VSFSLGLDKPGPRVVKTSREALRIGIRKAVEARWRRVRYTDTGPLKQRLPIGRSFHTLGITGNAGKTQAGPAGNSLAGLRGDF